MIKKSVIKLLNKLPYIKTLYAQNEYFNKKYLPENEKYIQSLITEKDFYKNYCLHPLGHYYSPVINIDEVLKQEDRIWENETKSNIPNLNLNVEEQVDLMKQLAKHYKQLCFTEEKKEEFRYYYNNQWFSYSDAILLFCMINHFKPKHIIEMGSGFSSALMLDTNKYFFNHTINLTFIEPESNRLKSLLTVEDLDHASLVEKNIQEVPIEIFKQLNEGDFLFIDSSHVVKTGSDVNYIIFEILPILKKGVLIHFHDIFYPFEYPKAWIEQRFNWNEIYLIRALLQFSSSYSIKLFPHYLHLHYPSVFNDMPLTKKEFGGSLWLVKN